MLGRGGFGKVKAVTRHIDEVAGSGRSVEPVYFAMKMMEKCKLTDEDNIEVNIENTTIGLINL